MIIVDFDGTIVDVWNRFYAVFCQLTQGRAVDIATYKEMKSALLDDGAIAQELHLEMADGYWEKKRSLLEDHEYLLLDKLLVDPEYLIEWFRAHDALILTMRRNRDNLMWEMRKLGLDAIVDKAVVVDPDSGMTKQEWVEKEGFGSCVEAVIGDSAQDMTIQGVKHARYLHVSTGLQGCEKIKRVRPSLVVCSDIQNALSLLD